METTNIFDFWEKGNKELLQKNELSEEEILNYIKKNTKSTSWYFGFNLVFYSFFLLACIIMTSMNLPGYAENKVIKPLLIIQLIISVLFLVYGIILYVKHRELKNYQINTYQLIEKQLRFYRSYHEVWMFIIALSTLMLIFNLGIFVDYTDGSYPINNKKMYIIINGIIFLFIYGVQKLAAQFNLGKLQSYLLDLKSGFLNESRKIEKRKKWLIYVNIILFVIFMITFILGMMKFLG